MTRAILATTAFLMAAACNDRPVTDDDYGTGASLFLFDDVAIMTMRGGDPARQEAMDVLVVDGRISKIADEIAAPAGTRVIDGTGKTLLPGLIDMHVHVWDEVELNAYLAHGVTTVRNMAGMPIHFEMVRKIGNRDMLGPRIITTGPILNSPGPNASANHQLVTTAEEARAAVAQQDEAGYRHLKVYSNLTRDAYEAILEEAAARGMTISGHTPEGVREDGIPFEKPFNIAFEEILDDGFITIEHMESIVWHALYDDLDDGKARALARQLAQAGVTVDPTLLSHHALQMMAETDGAWNQRPDSGMVNPLLLKVDRGSYEFWAQQPADLRRDFDTFYARAAKIFHEEGVTMVTGTDAGIFTNIPGAALTRELELLTGAGIPAADVLKMATVNGAVTLGLGSEIGQIAPGFLAEMILVEGDPLADISVVEHPAGVLQGTAWHDTDALGAMHAAAFAANPDRTLRNFEAAMAAQQLP